MKSFFSKRRIFEKWPKKERSWANELPYFYALSLEAKENRFICYKLITPQGSDDGLKRWDCQLWAGSGTGPAAMGGYGADCMQAYRGWNLRRHQPAKVSLHALLQSAWINGTLSWDDACASYFSNRKSWRLWENWSGKGCFSLTWKCAKSSRTTGSVLWWAESRLLPKQSAQGHADTGEITSHTGEWGPGAFSTLINKTAWEWPTALVTQWKIPVLGNFYLRELKSCEVCLHNRDFQFCLIGDSIGKEQTKEGRFLKQWFGYSSGGFRCFSFWDALWGAFVLVMVSEKSHS